MPVKILEGDVFAGLAALPDNSMDCCVTSPPYWGLRDYGVDGQLGMEKTLDEHLEAMVRVFEEVRRVLNPEGTLWLNYGDCYATQPNGRSAADVKALGKDDRTFRDKPFSTIGGVLKPKDLAMIPNRLAIALQEAGWYVRSECIWAKPNPMPESVRDRPATSHEKIFLLTKTKKYYYNYEGTRKDIADSSAKRYAQDIEGQAGSVRANGGAKTNGAMKAVGGPRSEKQRGHSSRHQGFNERWDGMTKAEQCANSRAMRNYEPEPLQVWEMGTASFKDAHFATFPPELVERCLLAGCPEGGTVLDPFGGAGTTGLVADKMQRNAVMIELNPAYAGMAIRRIEGDNPMFTQVDLVKAPFDNILL